MARLDQWVIFFWKSFDLRSECWREVFHWAQRTVIEGPREKRHLLVPVAVLVWRTLLMSQAVLSIWPPGSAVDQKLNSSGHACLVFRQLHEWLRAVIS